LLGLSLGVVLLGDGQAARAADQVRPALHVVRLKPLTVAGTGFKPRERIVLRLTGDATGTARGTATARGTLTVKFPKALTACSLYAIRARGTAGSRAALRSKLKASCRPVATADFGTSAIVTGKRFRPRERLTVTLIGDGTHTKTVTATAKGAMEADFGALSLSNCSAYTLKIKGSKGSTFTKKHPTVPC
jgi:hypothetical protein